MLPPLELDWSLLPHLLISIRRFRFVALRTQELYMQQFSTGAVRSIKLVYLVMQRACQFVAVVGWAGLLLVCRPFALPPERIV